MLRFYGGGAGRDRRLQVRRNAPYFVKAVTEAYTALAIDFLVDGHHCEATVFYFSKLTDISLVIVLFAPYKSPTHYTH